MFQAFSSIRVGKFLFWMLSKLRFFSLSGPSAAQTASACVLTHTVLLIHARTHTHTCTHGYTHPITITELHSLFSSCCLISRLKSFYRTSIKASRRAGLSLLSTFRIIYFRNLINAQPAAVGHKGQAGLPFSLYRS